MVLANNKNIIHIHEPNVCDYFECTHKLDSNDTKPVKENPIGVDW